MADYSAHRVACRVTSTTSNGQHAPDVMLFRGLPAITTPTDLPSLSAVVGIEPVKASVGAETPSPQTVEAFALTEDDFDEEQQSQSAHDRDLVDRILTRYGSARKDTVLAQTLLGRRCCRYLNIPCIALCRWLIGCGVC